MRIPSLRTIGIPPATFSPNFRFMNSG